jgi:hypothetical protein
MDARLSLAQSWFIFRSISSRPSFGFSPVSDFNRLFEFLGIFVPGALLKDSSAQAQSSYIRRVAHSLARS